MDVTKYSPMKKSLMGSNINGVNADDAFEVSNIIYGNIKSGDSIQQSVKIKTHSHITTVNIVKSEKH